MRGNVRTTPQRVDLGVIMFQSDDSARSVERDALALDSHLLRGDDKTARNTAEVDSCLAVWARGAYKMQPTACSRPQPVVDRPGVNLDDHQPC